MKLRVERVRADAEATIGRLYIDGVYKCMTLEDQPREGEKVRGETRIPSGAYPVTLYTAGTKHAQYTNSYREKKSKDGTDWHKGMLLLNNVPNFSGVLIHKGNYEVDTEGCLLVGYGESRDANGHLSITDSRRAYEDLYDIMCEAYARGETVDIEIINEPRANPARTDTAPGGVVAAGGVIAASGTVVAGQVANEASREPDPVVTPTPAPGTPDNPATTTSAPSNTDGAATTTQANPDSPAASTHTEVQTPQSNFWPPSAEVTTLGVLVLGAVISLLALVLIMGRMRAR